MAKKERTPEQIEADRQRMAKVRAARDKVKQPIITTTSTGTANAVYSLGPVHPQPQGPPVVLDLTEQVLDTEGQLIQYILWEYDQGRCPTDIKISPNQAVNVANFTKIKPVRLYQSPFGNHNIRIVTSKELENDNS